MDKKQPLPPSKSFDWSWLLKSPAKLKAERNGTPIPKPNLDNEPWIALTEDQKKFISLRKKSLRR